jgi:putative aminophosphonate oxidoreductase
MGWLGVSATTAMRSLWLQEALSSDRDEASVLEGDVRADVCIVGGGYTGLWTALRLKEEEPSLDVAMVEADICGGGASGRNGGFVLTWWSKFITLQKLCGTEEALRLAQASADAVAGIGKFCADHGIDAHYHRDGWLWAATNRAQLGSWNETLEAAHRAGARPFVEWAPEECQARTGSRVHVGGVFEPSGAIVQPALLARGLRRVALSRGVRIFEHSPMTRLEGRSPAVVHTSRGSVTAGGVVVAMNAWGVHLREVRRAVLVVASDIVATEPIPDRLAEVGWGDGLCISDGRLLVHYYRTTDDGRIAFGKGGGMLAFGPNVGARFDGRSPRRATVEAHFRRTYPMLHDVNVASSWTGPIDRTRTGLPFFQPLESKPNVFVGVGYSGNGVGPSYVGGRILASLALGREDEWSTCGLVRSRPGGFPPEPIRYLGGNLVKAAIVRKERAEDAGRKPGRIATSLVKLAPPGLVPNKRG